MAEVVEFFERYSWDQSAKAVTVYVPVEGGEMESNFGERCFSLRVREGSIVRELKVVNLCKAIDPEKSKALRKPDRIQLKLMKVVREDWSDLTDDLDRKNAERAKRVADGDLKDASTNQLLADLYKTATDDERETLKAAALEGHLKRERDKAK